jgi:hypothetical protein
MNASMLTADRATHIKIIAMGLTAAVLLLWLAIAVH